MVKLTSQDVLDGTSNWSAALIVYVLGDEPTLVVMRRFVLKTWNFVALPEVFFRMMVSLS